MKKLMRLLLAAALLCACLPAAGEELTEVRCEEWKFSLRVPAGTEAVPRVYQDWDTEQDVAGGLALAPAADGSGPRIHVMRRSRLYNAADYLGAWFPDYLEELGDSEAGDCGIYRLDGRTLYGNTGTVSADGAELFREIRLIPCDDTGLEFTARYTAETEQEALALLDTVIRDCQTDEAPEKTEARFLPKGHGGEADLRNGEWLLRVEDADKIGTEGFFTAALYLPDWYTPEDVHAMKPGDTILIMDRVLTITGIEPDEGEDGSWFAAELYARDDTLAGERFVFTLLQDEEGTAYWPYAYKGEDCHSASRAGEIRIRVPQELPVPYFREEADETYLLAGDVLAAAEGDPALFGIGWNEYTHRCVLEDGKLTRIETWSYPVNPEDPLDPW